MTTAQSKPLGQKWKERLDLAYRETPELYENADDVKSTPYAKAIRTAIKELDVSAVFCVQRVPTIAILLVDEYDRQAIVNLHAALWNQGLANLLLVLSDNDDTVRAFSLARIPHSGENHDFEKRCLFQILEVVANVLPLKNIIYGTESGRLWENNAKYFKNEERIDRVLLKNLIVSHGKLLDTGLSTNAAQALLIQTMFIAYLEDRKIIGRNYFRSISGNRFSNFSELLYSGNVLFLNRLFQKLHEDFNGDFFVSPCSFGTEAPGRHPERSHLEIIARFRSGKEEMSEGAGQFRFWGYDFKYIPIELISAVYDRFLSEREDEQRKQGIYYTPMFLADTVISQTWDTLPPTTQAEGQFLDPACGSGMFLVRLFQRLCEHRRELLKIQKIQWEVLLSILSRLHGWDLDGAAVHIAVFSLYVALLEEVTPPDIQHLIRGGNILPKLRKHNLRSQDFFTTLPEDEQFDVVIGNPPWSSRRGANRSSINWCEREDLPMPSKEDAWAFVWKSLRHLREGGTAAFLLPAMGFLHNHSENAVDARKRFMREARVSRIVNFADLRFQLFESAVRPAALIIFARAVQDAPAYRFDYWTPKADLNLKTRRLITLSSADRRRITSSMIEKDPLIFKKHLWMTDPEAKLFSYLSRLPKLGDLVSEYKTLKRAKKGMDENWVIGQGFKPFNPDRPTQYFISDYVEIIPYLPIKEFKILAQPTYGLSPWKSKQVHRKGFERGFKGPRILIPGGISATQTSGISTTQMRMRLRASYVEKPLVFRHVIQSIVVPRGEERRAKLLTALLNSKIILWFAFHGTASFGSDRPLVHQAELLRLPFPSSSDMGDIQKSQVAENKLISIIDRALESTDKSLQFQQNEKEILREIDHLSSEFFCLSEEEITLIDDTVERIIPAVQPRRGNFPEIWQSSNRSDRRAYADTLVCAMTNWFNDNVTIGVNLEAHNEDLAILRLFLQREEKNSKYVEKNDISVSEELSYLSEHAHRRLDGNFQLIPNIRVFVGENLYLVKPLQKRFWLRSAALADADSIALDLQDAIKLPQ